MNSVLIYEVNEHIMYGNCWHYDSLAFTAD